MALISKKIRQIKYNVYGFEKYCYIRIEPNARLYDGYEDCKAEVNPITDKNMLSKMLPKIKDHIKNDINSRELIDEEKKNMAIDELNVIFENIIKTNQ